LYLEGGGDDDGGLESKYGRATPILQDPYIFENLKIFTSMVKTLEMYRNKNKCKNFE